MREPDNNTLRVTGFWPCFLRISADAFFTMGTKTKEKILMRKIKKSQTKKLKLIQEKEKEKEATGESATGKQMD